MPKQRDGKWLTIFYEGCKVTDTIFIIMQISSPPKSRVGPIPTLEKNCRPLSISRCYRLTSSHKLRTTYGFSLPALYFGQIPTLIVGKLKVPPIFSTKLNISPEPILSSALSIILSVSLIECSQLVLGLVHRGT